MSHLTASELIINPDGSIYHLNLHPEHMADTIITVGDQNRVKQVSKHFDYVETKITKREFTTHTGFIGKKRITVISTGIGTDNIDIVFNELDALANIDFETRAIKPEFRQLDFIRIGTSGAIRKDLEVDSFVVSQYALGLDNLMHFYQYDKPITNSFHHLGKSIGLNPYLTMANTDLMEGLATDLPKGITITSPGFYAPQGRQLRGKTAINNLIQQSQLIDIEGLKCTNLEMETAGIYGMSSLLGHRAISFNALLANRISGTFSRQPKVTVERLIELVLGRIEGMG